MCACSCDRAMRSCMGAADKPMSLQAHDLSKHTHTQFTLALPHSRSHVHTHQAHMRALPTHYTLPQTHTLYPTRTHLTALDRLSTLSLPPTRRAAPRCPLAYRGVLRCLIRREMRTEFMCEEGGIISHCHAICRRLLIPNPTYASRIWRH